MQPACNSILEASEAGFHHCCVSYASVGTQTDEPMDLSEKKFQELYFVVYICLLFIFAMLHDIRTLVIRQLYQPIILSALSFIHQSHNLAQLP